MEFNIEANIHRLQELMQNTSPDDLYLELWDKNTILQENKPTQDVQRERVNELRKQGIAQPIHKHNIVDYGNSKQSQSHN